MGGADEKIELSNHPRNKARTAVHAALVPRIVIRQRHARRICCMTVGTVQAISRRTPLPSVTSIDVLKAKI